MSDQAAGDFGAAELIKKGPSYARRSRPHIAQEIGVNRMIARLFLAGLIIVAVAAFTSSVPSARAAGYPDFVGCNPEEPALAAVANLHHVSMRTACHLTIAIQKHEPPVNPEKVTPDHPCTNPFAHMHRFRGWRLRIRPRGYGTMKRGRSSFAFEYQDGPLACI